MSQNVVIVALLLVGLVTSAPSPLQVTIDCSSDEIGSSTKSKSAEISNGNSSFDVNSFCSFIHKAIPKAIEDGKFIVDTVSDNDMTDDSNSPISSVVRPPSDYIKTFPKPKISRLRAPRINVPKLKSIQITRAPRLGAPMKLSIIKKIFEEETSAERIERFKNGVQKMLHFVKVLAQIDEYLSERTRIVIDKLSKTLLE